MRRYITKVDGAGVGTAEGTLKAVEDDWRFAEMVNAVITAGITPDAYNAPTDSDVRMLAQAMARYASAAVYCQDAGNANVYILKLTNAFQAPKSYFTGLCVFFYPAHSSTDASIVNAFGLGSKKILRPDGSLIGAGDITAERLVFAVYDEALDGGSGAFRLAPWAIPYAAQTPSAVPLDGEGVDIDDVYRANLAYNLLSAATPAGSDLFPFFSVQSNAHRNVTEAQLLATIVAALSSGNLSLPKIGAAFKVEERRPNLVKRPVTTFNAWFRRPLSDVVINQVTGASLNGSNQIILPKGTYRGSFLGAIAKTKNTRARLYNVSAGAPLGLGTTVDAYASDASSAPSVGSVWFSLSVPSVVELQAYVVSGQASAFGDTEVNDIGSGNYYVDGSVSLVKEG
ncbi:MAG: hypothetical protein J0H37_10655 [Hyphomicrobium denitrificans]|nr:hypothetical protein [Hyphomicrobium denitrificans]